MMKKFYGVSLVALAMVMNAGSVMGATQTAKADVKVQATVLAAATLDFNSNNAIDFGRIDASVSPNELESVVDVEFSGNTGVNFTMTGSPRITQVGAAAPAEIPFSVSVSTDGSQYQSITSSGQFSTTPVDVTSASAKTFQVKFVLENPAIAPAGVYETNLVATVVSAS